MTLDEAIKALDALEEDINQKYDPPQYDGAGLALNWVGRDGTADTPFICIGVSGRWVIFVDRGKLN